MASVENFPVGMAKFINYTPSTKEQYSAMGVSVVVHITGIKETQASLLALEDTPDLKAWMEHAMEQLEEIMFNTAPVDTGKYRDSIRATYNSTTNDGELEIHNVPYAKYLIYGSKTLYHAAYDKNRKGIKWPYTRTEGSIGILHDVRRIVYAWEHWFDIGLDEVNFAQPRTRLGRFAEGTF